MPLTRDQFAKSVVASGLISGDELQTFWKSLPADARPTDGDAFARRLVAAGKLTDFQAGEILAGRAAPLVLEPYVIVGRIGAGGMGQVYKAQHRRMKRVVALKVLPAAAMQDEAAVKRFQREVEAAARLSHPNIVQAYDAGVQQGVHYLVMEFVDGADLSQAVEQRGTLPVAEAVDYMLQAARGLAFAHGEGVVHRDIKPANLLLDKRGTVKILDMGLARLDMGGAEGELTNSGQVMGTVDYMAPEQALDTKHADARADIYALGCTLYRLVTGELLYEGDTMLKKLLAHRESPIPSLRGRESGGRSQGSGIGVHSPARDSIFATLDPIFQKMVAKKPEDRYQTMAEVVAELEGLRGDTQARSASEGTGDRGQGTGSQTPADPALGSFLAGLGKKKTGSTASPAAAKTFQAAASRTDGFEETIDRVELSENTSNKIASLITAPEPAESSNGDPQGSASPVVLTKKKANPKLILYGSLAAGVLSLIGIPLVFYFALTGSGDPKRRPTVSPLPATGVGSGVRGPAQFSDWQPLFDGKTLAGWKQSSKSNDWKLENGELVSTKDNTLTYIDQEFADFDLRFECRNDTGRQAELAFRRALGAAGIKTQASGTVHPDRYALNLKSQPKFEIGSIAGRAAASGPKNDEATWNRYELSARGAHFTVKVNGIEVVSYTDSENRCPLGQFALYAAQPGVRFRNIEVRVPTATGATAGSSSSAGFALEFDGATSYVEIPTLELTAGEARTVEFWISDCGPASRHCLFDLMGGSSGRLHLDFVPLNAGAEANWTVFGTWNANHNTNFYSAVQPFPIAAQHVAIVISASSSTPVLFIDGQPQSGKLGVFGFKPPAAKGAVLGAYRQADGKRTNFFQGRLRQARVSKVSRYAAQFTPPPQLANDSDTLALYLLGEGLGSQLTDSSGKNNHGKIVGAKWVAGIGAGAPLQPPGFALEFDGQTNHVLVPKLPLDRTKPITLEAWLVPHTAQSADFAVARFGPGTGPHSTLGISRLDRWIMADYASQGWRVLLTRQRVPNQRVHVAGIWLPGGQRRMYFDGTPVAGSDVTGPDVNPAEPITGEFMIGSLGNRYCGFPGIIDELRVSQTARYDAAFAPASRFDPDDKTVALYHFDEGTGDQLLDSSPNKHHGKITGAKWVAGIAGGPAAAPQPSGYALDFDGKTGHVAIPTWKYQGDHPLTIEAWAAKRGTSKFQMLWGDMEGRGLDFAVTDLNWIFQLGTSQPAKVRVLSLAPPVEGRHTHLAAVFSGNDMRLFVDGRQQGVPVPYNEPYQPANRLFYLGAQPQANDAPALDSLWNGQLDEVRISKIARYTADFTPKPRFDSDADTLALYHFDEGSGDQLTDSSPNKHHGKIVGAKWVPGIAGGPAAIDAAAWQPLFNGQDLTGWTGDTGAFQAMPAQNKIQALGTRGILYTEQEYADFELEAEFGLTPGANNGIVLRAPGTGDPAFSGLEIQVFDDASKPNLRTHERTGSIWGVAPASGGQLKTVGEWNKILIRAEGPRITVDLNGVRVTDADLDAFQKTGPLDGKPHPGLANKKGKIGLYPVSGITEFRNLRVRELTTTAKTPATIPTVP